MTLQLIFFDGEESFVGWSGNDHTYGSRNLAERWNKKPFKVNNVEGTVLDRIDLFILLDLIGTLDTSFKCLKKNTQVLTVQIPWTNCNLNYVISSHAQSWFKKFARIESSLKKMDLLSTSKELFRHSDWCSKYSGVEDDHMDFEKHGLSLLNPILEREQGTTRIGLKLSGISGKDFNLELLVSKDTGKLSLLEMSSS